MIGQPKGWSLLVTLLSRDECISGGMEKSRQVIIPLDQTDTLFLLELGARIKIDLDQMLVIILFFSFSQTHSSGDQGTERETHHRLKHPSAPEDTRVRREAHLQTTETSQCENLLQLL